ncbi:MAG TPA: hypothetical protein VN894_01680, partial [Polyangiaceae bacterium]|nr:hypothetical protein [Polyangiaceae bacterium]
VEKSVERDALLVAHSCLGVRAFYRVNFAEARAHLKIAAELMDLVDPRTQHLKLVDSDGFEGILSGPLWLAWIEALEGNEAGARRQVRIAHQLADRIGDPYIQCQVAAYSAALHRELHDLEEARVLAGRVIALSTEHGLHFWKALGLCVLGWVNLQDGKVQEGMAMVEGGLALLDAVGSTVNRSHFACYLLEACLDAGRLDPGLRLANDALSVCREGLGPMYEPELLRLKGALLLRLGSEDEALEHFRAALAETRLQGVRLLELRAAVSLSQLLRRRGKIAEAAGVLEISCHKWPAPIVGHDIDAARAVLTGLSAA